MRNLFNFIIKYSTWFVFVFYVAFSCSLLFNSNFYQKSVYLTSANSVSSSVNGVASSITEYFHLHDVNEDLQNRNAALENELLNLKNQLKYYATIVSTDSVNTSSYSYPNRYDYVIASVLNNSVNRPRNYFTINKGLHDGIKLGMGVVDQNGIVGIVNVVGNNTSRIISLLNMTQHFSVKVKNSDYVGTLSWQEGNPHIAYVEEMPRHVKYHVGDTIVTSGYSTTFPDGIPVGIIISRIKTNDDNFFTLKIKLASDFPRLSTVRVIKDDFKTELDSLEQFDAKSVD